MIKVIYWIVFMIASFFAVDGLLTYDRWEAGFAGFLLFGIVIHHSITNEKIIN